VLAAKEKTVSPGAPPLQSETRIWGVKPENEMLIGRCSQVSSTLQWGSWHFYAGTASGELVNRYYSNAYGRFMTPDSYVSQDGPRSPQSWNRYAYSVGDSVNYIDPQGRDQCSPNDPNCSSGCDPSDPSCTTTCDPSDPSCTGYCAQGDPACGGSASALQYGYMIKGESIWLNSLVTSGLINSWSFVTGTSGSMVQFSVGNLLLTVPFYAVRPTAAPPSGGYWAYVSCFLTGITGSVITHPEIPGVSVWAMLQGLLTGAAWGPGVAVVGGVTITVDIFNIENQVAHDCAKQTGYTPWILQN
jgi:RHS repeat-associated protein